MNSAVKYPYDAATAFRAPGSAALTSTATSDPVALDRIVNGRGDVNDILGGQAYSVVLFVEDFDDADGDESYTLSVVADNTEDLSDSPVTIQTVTVSGTGVYAVYLDADTLEKVEGGVLALGVTATLGGTSPSLTYGAWLVPVVA